MRLRLAGVCSTDLELSRGYMGFEGVLGHEFVGDVIEATDPAWIGERVVGGINAACLACDFCARDLHRHCEARTVLGILGRDGVLQETFLLPERNLVRVPEHVSDEQAVFAEPLAAALRILEQLDLAPWDRVAVLGDGKLGLLCAWALAEQVHSVTLYGRRPGRV
ncbi:MAG: alcohol dehydrogenase catalytic domain-containing protein, partial [Planctomycetota bacterium JB042]